jgi:hypothetical protein
MDGENFSNEKKNTEHFDKRISPQFIMPSLQIGVAEKSKAM